MSNNKLAIIGGSGLYNIEGLSNIKSLKINTPWGDPSDEILKATFDSKEVLFFTKTWQRSFHISVKNQF